MASPAAHAHFRSGLLTALLVCLSAGTAAAQQPTAAQTSAIKQNCRGDYQSYCASIPPGGAASLQCLQQNMSRLSPNCGSAVGAVAGGTSGAAQAPSSQTSASQARPPTSAPPAMSPRQEAGLLRRACAGDYRAYCRGVPLGGGRAIGCLKENQARLSRACRGALAEMRAGR